MSNLSQFAPRIKSIQTGSGSTSSTLNVTISSVDTTKTIVNVLGYTGPDTSATAATYCKPAARLVNATTVEVSFIFSSAGVVHFQVVEFY